MRLEPGHCAVWLGRAPSLTSAADLELLEPQERAANERLVKPVNRACHAFTHALLRRALSRVVDRDPRAWRLLEGTNGRPLLAGEHEGIDFNLSHSGRFAACALVRDERVGIDVETIDDRVDFHALLGHVASPVERDWLGKQPIDMARKNFYRMWVLKEACSKATGEGLRLPFNEITLMPGPGGVVNCDLAAIAEAPEHWSFAQYDLGRDAQMAVAVRGAQEKFEFELVAGAELTS